MKKNTSFFKHLCTGLSFLGLFLQIGSHDAAYAVEKSGTRYLIEDIGSISQDYTYRETGFLQAAYKNSTGEDFSFPKSAPKQTSETGLLPDNYDLRTENLISPVKDQKNTGCCWSFATLKSLESNLVRSRNIQISQMDLSENHLAWYLYHPSVQKSDSVYGDGISFKTGIAKKNYQKKPLSYRKKYSFQDYYHTLPYLNGGNALFGTSILARWSGASLEKKVPFTAGTEKLLSQMGNRMESSSEKLRYQTDYILTDAICYDEADPADIKKALMDYGALEVSLYYDANLLNQSASGDFTYYQTKHTENPGSYANHCVTIAGWDDHYPKENFATIPKDNGAWLMANSYGTDFGNQGYFWVSYDEPSLVDFYSFRGKEKIYDHNYQYDGSGWTVALAPQNMTGSRAANLFRADIKYTQTLEAVSFYTATNHQPYTITIYVNVTKGKPESGKKALTFKGTQEYRGYHTVTLPKSIFLKAGQYFSVVLSLKQTSETNGYLPVEGFDHSLTGLRIHFSSKDKESYYYACVTDTKTNQSSCRWTDLNQTTIRTISAPDGAIYHNVCIKAFTKNSRHAGIVRFSKKKLILKKGSRKIITISVKKTSDHKIIYKNSRKSIAAFTVPKSGKLLITARKKGKTRITATLASGAYAKLVVIVR